MEKKQDCIDSLINEETNLIFPTSLL